MGEYEVVIHRVLGDLVEVQIPQVGVVEVEEGTVVEVGLIMEVIVEVMQPVHEEDHTITE